MAFSSLANSAHWLSVMWLVESSMVAVGSWQSQGMFIAVNLSWRGNLQVVAFAVFMTSL